jgi:hypothetical protein
LHDNFLEPLHLRVATWNLDLWTRTLTGLGTPRALHGRLAANAGRGIAR